MKKIEVMIVTGAGQISMAIARRIGFGLKIVLGDKKQENAETIAKIMNEAGCDVVPMVMDLIFIDGGATASYFYGPLKPRE